MTICNARRGICINIPIHTLDEQLTPLGIQLLQDFTDNLSNRLQGLDVILRLVKVFLKGSQTKAYFVTVSVTCTRIYGKRANTNILSAGPQLGGAPRVSCGSLQGPWRGRPRQSSLLHDVKWLIHTMEYNYN